MKKVIITVLSLIFCISLVLTSFTSCKNEEKPNTGETNQTTDKEENSLTIADYELTEAKTSNANIHKDIGNFKKITTLNELNNYIKEKNLQEDALGEVLKEFDEPYFKNNIILLIPRPESEQGKTELLSVNGKYKDGKTDGTFGEAEDNGATFSAFLTREKAVKDSGNTDVLVFKLNREKYKNLKQCAIKERTKENLTETITLTPTKTLETENLTINAKDKIFHDALKNIPTLQILKTAEELNRLTTERIPEPSAKLKAYFETYGADYFQSGKALILVKLPSVYGEREIMNLKTSLDTENTKNQLNIEINRKVTPNEDIGTTDIEEYHLIAFEVETKIIDSISEINLNFNYYKMTDDYFQNLE